MRTSYQHSLPRPASPALGCPLLGLLLSLQVSGIFLPDGQESRSFRIWQVPALLRPMLPAAASLLSSTAGELQPCTVAQSHTFLGPFPGLLGTTYFSGCLGTEQSLVLLDSGETSVRQQPAPVL